MSEEQKEIDPYKPLPDKKAESIRRKRIMPELIQEYLQPDTSADIKYFEEKYGIPDSTIFYHFDKEGVSRKDITKRKSEALKEVRSVETAALSAEAEKIATIAISIGGVIARRYLDFIDYEVSHGKSYALIAEDIMQWYEAKHITQARENELEAEIEKMRKELSAAWAMSLPNFKYWLRTRILERYATQVIKARMMGTRLPISNIINAMQTDLLKLEGDVNDLFEGENKVGIES